MNYSRLETNLLKYGRDKGYAYVCSTYKPRLREDPKYKQWQRVLKRAQLLAMTPKEREILRTMLQVKAAVLINTHTTIGD